LQLRLALAALLFVPFILSLSKDARADDSFTAKTQVYVDNDHTTVVSPLVAITRDAWKGGTLSASYVADVVSSASIDVVSNATSHMDDFRSEITAGIAQKLKATTIAGSYIYSVEHDYSSHNAAINFAQDFLQRNSTLAIGFTFTDNAVGRSGDQSFHRTLLNYGVAGSWTQTITSRTIMQLSYTFSYADGYQASPYRFVRVESITDGSTLYKVPETDPNDRYRHAFVLALNQHLFTDSAFQTDFRYYFDNWGIQSVTIQARYLTTFKDVTLRFRGRFYYQTAADFYQPDYTELQPFMTVDRELSKFWSVLVGAKLSWRLPWVHRALALEVKGDFFYYDYLNFPLLKSRIGGTTELGLNVIY
jgi:hypothetical protein